MPLCKVSSHRDVVGEDTVVLAGESAATGACKELTESCARAGGRREGFTDEGGLQLQVLPWAGGFKHSSCNLYAQKDKQRDREARKRKNPGCEEGTHVY